jgi:O-antigen/teichoic acid export membrane protein
VVRKNIIANITGSALSALLSIAFIPLYIHFLGIEAYGLVGFFATLQALFVILDLGLTSTVTRELARLSVVPDAAAEVRNLVRTLEMIYWGVALFIVLLLMLLAPWIATKWLNTSVLDAETTRRSLVLMGGVIALRMPYAFYGGGLLGLQRQALMNVIKVAVEVLKGGGVVLVLWLVSPTITAFFLWQLLASAAGAFLMYLFLWRNLPASAAKPAFQSSLLRRLWRFMAGMSGIAVLSVILVETDKLVLSKMLDLSDFAYYALASTVAMGLHVIIVPLFSAVYPRLTQLVENNDEVALKQLYHKSCQFMTVLVMPIALVVSAFSGTIMRVWTQNEPVSLNAAPILSLLIIGTALNGMMNIPYALQLAHGWTRLSIVSSVMAISVLIPLLLVVVPVYGPVGAAAIWILLNTGYILFNVPIMHAKLMKGEFGRWLFTDFGLPAIATLLVVALLRVMMPADMGVAGEICWIILVFSLALGASILAAPAIRVYVGGAVSTFRLSRRESR